MELHPILDDPALEPAGSPGRRAPSRILGFAFALAVLVAFVVTAAKPASAVTTRLLIGEGKASCPAGYVCLWILNNFTGTGYAFYNSETNYATLPAPFNGIQDFSWSFYNHGNTYDIQFFRNSGWTGDSFILCKDVAIDALPPNSSINPPGAGVEPGQPWRDQISSHHFGSWC